MGLGLERSLLLEQVQQAPSFWAVNSSSQLKMDHLTVMFNVFMHWLMVFKMSSAVKNVYYCHNFSTGSSTTNLDVLSFLKSPYKTDMKIFD